MAQWKHAERRVAKALGGKRISRGSNFGESLGDIEHEWLSPEIKYRKEIPKYINDWLYQARGYSAHKLACLVLLAKGKSWKDGVVMVRLGDFVDHFGGFKGKKKVNT